MTASSPATAAPKRLAPVVIVAGVVAALVLLLAFGRNQHREPGLTEEQARYLQDVEHLGGFVFGDLCLPRLARALDDQSHDELMALVSPEFTGGWLFEKDQPGSVKTHGHITLTQQRRDGSDTKETNCSGRQFVEWLLEERRGFASLESVGAKVKRMQPETPGKLDGPWDGTLLVTLAGRTAEGRIRETRIELACRLEEIDDQSPERGGWFRRLSLMRHDVVESATALMEEMTDETGIDVTRLQDNWVEIGGPQIPALTGGVYLADYDGDRHVDCLLTDIRGLALYRGLGNGRFENVTAKVGLPIGAIDLAAAWGDFDNDGDPDLVLGQHFFRNDLIDSPGKRRRRFIRLASVKTGLDLLDAVGYAVADVDLDGRLDLYAVGIGKPSSGQKWIGHNDTNRNQLWQNDGDLHFTDVTKPSGTAGRGTSTFAAVFFDANNDGNPDLMTACEFGRNDFWLGRGDGTFAPAELPEIYGGFSMGLTVGDFDNDGFADPFLANMYSKAGERVVANLPRGVYDADVDSQLRDFVAGSDLYHNTAGTGFKRIGRAAGVADVGWAYGPAYVDLDNDGRLDLYAPCGFQSISRERPDG